MKIIKPDNLAIVHRSLHFARRDSLAIGMIAGFRFGQAGLAGLLPENQVWPIVTQALGKDAILDEGHPKPAGEYKVYGAAHAPAGTQVELQRVSVRIGSQAKSVIVTGDRQFNALGLIGAPKPYARMPIDPATAFGGAGFADNPLGKGFAEIDNGDGTRYWPLPNVEIESRRMASRGERVAPAGFWGFDITAPLRQLHLGVCDERWLKQEWPHLPSDTRPELFLSAPLDQRLSGYFAGDEAFQLDNMHPQTRSLQGRLPALRARCFVNRKTAEGDVLSELPAHAETVWLFPELECGAVLYRALVGAADADASDIRHIMAEWELMSDAPLPFEHYRDLFRQKLPEAAKAAPAAAAPKAAPAAAAPKAALAVDVPKAAPAAAAPQTGSADTQSAAAAQVAVTASAPSAAQAAEPHLASAHGLAEELNTESRARMQQYNLTDADLAPFLKPEAPERVPTLAEIGKMAGEVQAQARALMLKHNLTDADLIRVAPPGTLPGMGGLPLSGAEPIADFAALGALLKPSAPPKLKVPRLAPPAAAPAAPLTREDVIARHGAHESLAGYDLSGLDLSELDLSGADFSGATLDKTSFAKSRLAEVNFERALLRETDFSETDLQRAQLAKASAAKGRFTKADLRGAQLGEGDFTGADFSASQLANSDLRGAVFDQAKLPGVNASACRAERASFTGCDLSGANFSGAALMKASFSGSRLGGSNFSAAACQQAEFYGVEAPEAVFADANLSGSRADAATRFDQVRFTRTQLGRACWEGVQIRGATFEHAMLDHADFSNAQAQAAQFGASSAKGARFAQADLSGANLDAVNLFQGSLRKANISGTLLRSANLYGVDFEGTQPTIASVEGSDIGRTILQFRPPVI
jgi:uncharacterized protein YjbI with pentapeptide repeats